MIWEKAELHGPVSGDKTLKTFRLALMQHALGTHLGKILVRRCNMNNTISMINNQHDFLHRKPSENLQWEQNLGGNPAGWTSSGLCGLQISPSADSYHLLRMRKDRKTRFFPVFPG